MSEKRLYEKPDMEVLDIAGEDAIMTSGAEYLTCTVYAVPPENP